MFKSVYCNETMLSKIMFFFICINAQLSQLIVLSFNNSND